MKQFPPEWILRDDFSAFVQNQLLAFHLFGATGYVVLGDIPLINFVELVAFVRYHLTLRKIDDCWKWLWEQQSLGICWVVQQESLLEINMHLPKIVQQLWEDDILLVGATFLVFAITLPPLQPAYQLDWHLRNQ